MTISTDDVRRLVEELVIKILAEKQPTTGSHATTPIAKKVISEQDVLRSTGDIEVSPGTIVTPLARDTAKSRGIRFVYPSSKPVASEPAIAQTGVVAIGSDHGGFRLKEKLKIDLKDLGYTVRDLGCGSEDAVDYPDFARAVALAVARGEAWRGIMIDGAGIGSCMVANKVTGVRAALCHDQFTALNSREHNDANLLTLGSMVTGEGVAKQIVKTWLETPFAGGRHARRVKKIEGDTH